MPEQAAPAAASPKRGHGIAPFEIEVSNHNSGSVFFVALGNNKKLRGRWSSNRQGSRRASMSTTLLMLPDIPGMRIRINPNDGTADIYDPLESEPELLKKIANIMLDATQRSMGSHFTFVPRNKRTLDLDQMKTFLLDLRRSYDSSSPTFEVTRGEMPTFKEIESLEGRELNDPGDPSPRKAKYKDQASQHDLLWQAMIEKGLVR